MCCLLERLALASTMAIKAQQYNRMTRKARRKLRMLYVADQLGLCYYCKGPLHLQPPAHVLALKVKWRHGQGEKFLRHPIHLHHCHRTGKTLGAVHAFCNAVLWQFHGE